MEGWGRDGEPESPGDRALHGAWPVESGSANWLGRSGWVKTEAYKTGIPPPQPQRQTRPDSTSLPLILLPRASDILRRLQAVQHHLHT